MECSISTECPEGAPFQRALCWGFPSTSATPAAAKTDELGVTSSHAVAARVLLRLLTTRGRSRSLLPLWLRFRTAPTATEQCECGISSPQPSAVRMVLLLHLQRTNRRSRCRSHTEGADEHKAREGKNRHGITRHTAFLSGQNGAIEECRRANSIVSNFTS